MTSFNPSSQANSSVTKFSSLGVPTVITSGGLNLPIGIAIDANGYAWAANVDSVTKISPAGVGTNYPIADPNGAWYIAVDGSDNIWVSTYTGTVLYELSESNGPTSPARRTPSRAEHNPSSLPSTPPTVCGLRMETRRDCWSSAPLALIPPTTYICKPPIQRFVPTQASRSIAPMASGPSPMQILPTPPSNAGEGIGKYNTSGVSTLSVTNGSLDGDPVAIDGAGNVCDRPRAESLPVALVRSNTPMERTLVSQAGGFTGGSQNLPLGIAIDGSGNVWLSNSGTDTNGTVVELIGSAAPVVTPISPFYPGKTTNGLGIRP